MERHKFQGEPRSINGSVVMRCAYRANDIIGSVCLKLEGYEWHIPWEDCEYCGGSGLLNAEVIQVEDLGRQFSEDYWKSEVTWCHGCPRGVEWKELLNG